jgi:uncharacterized membrane protein
VNIADRTPTLFRVAVLLLVLGGMFFRFYHLDRKDYWEDEILGTIHMLGYTEGEIVERSDTLVDAASVQSYFHLPAAGGPKKDRLVDTLTSLELEDPQHPPLYYLMGHLWARVFGSSAEAIRALSAIFGVLALPCMFWLCLELFRSYAGAWLSVALLAVSPFHVLYSQEAREYSLWTVATLLTCTLFLRACRRMTLVDWLLYGSVAGISMYIYPFTGAVLVGQGLYLLATWRGRSRARGAFFAYLAATVAALALFLPWFLIMVRSDGLRRGMASILTTRMAPLETPLIFLRDVRGVFVDFGYFQWGPLHSATANGVFTLITTLLAGYAFYFIARHTPFAASSFVFIALCVPVAPLLLHDAFAGGHLVSQARYFIPFYLGAELAVAALLSAKLFDRTGRAAAAKPLWWGAAATVALAGIASCVVSSQATTWATKDYEVNRDVAGVINDADRPVIVSDAPASRLLGLSYYLAPHIPLRLHLVCDQCDVPAAGRADLIAGTARFGDVFLLGPSSRLEAQVQSLAESRSFRFRYVGITAFPQRATPLDLFLSV